MVFRTQVQLQSERGLCVCLSLSSSWGGLGYFSPVLCFSSLPGFTSVTCQVQVQLWILLYATRLQRVHPWRAVEATSVFEMDVLLLLLSSPILYWGRQRECPGPVRDRKEPWWHWKQKQKANWWWFNISDHLGDRARTKGFYTFKETEMPFWFNLRKSWKWQHTLPNVPRDWK